MLLLSNPNQEQVCLKHKLNILYKLFPNKCLTGRICVENIKYVCKISGFKRYHSETLCSLMSAHPAVKLNTEVEQAA